MINGVYTEPGDRCLLSPRGLMGAIRIRAVTSQRQTYAPFTSTRAQPATPAPTTAPPTTARRVVRRATPATLTGVNGLPTLACALSTAIEGPSPGDQLIDARVPKARVAVANNARLMPIFFIATSCAQQANDNDPRSVRLIQVKGFHWPAASGSTERLRHDEHQSRRPYTQPCQDSRRSFRAVLGTFL